MGKITVYYENGDNTKDGLFAQWVDENGFDDESLEQEMDGDPSVLVFSIDIWWQNALSLILLCRLQDCTIIEFDDNFPLLIAENDKEKRNGKIFKVIRYCYKNNRPPLGVEASDLELQIDEKEIEIVQQMYETQTPLIADAVCKEKDVMYFLATRYMFIYPSFYHI